MTTLEDIISGGAGSVMNMFMADLRMLDREVDAAAALRHACSEFRIYFAGRVITIFIDGVVVVNFGSATHLPPGIF